MAIVNDSIVKGDLKVNGTIYGTVTSAQQYPITADICIVNYQEVNAFSKMTAAYDAGKKIYLSAGVYYPNPSTTGFATIPLTLLSSTTYYDAFVFDFIKEGGPTGSLGHISSDQGKILRYSCSADAIEGWTSNNIFIYSANNHTDNATNVSYSFKIDNVAFVTANLETDYSTIYFV